MSRNKIVFLLSSILLLLSACQSGASATGEATNTFAAIATNTPTPTETPAPTKTPTPAPTATPILPFWEGESWILTELKEENSPRVVSNAVVFEDGGETWRLELKKTEGVENIRLLERNKHEWPVVIGDINGETRAYDPLSEVFLPMLDGFEYLHDYAEIAMQILVDTKEDVYSLEELETNGVIDWAKMDPNKGGSIHYVERVYEDENMTNLLLRLFVGKYFRLYTNEGRFVDIAQNIYNANKSSDNVSAQQLFTYVGLASEGEVLKTSGIHPNNETRGTYYDMRELNAIFSYGDYVKQYLFLRYDRYAPSLRAHAVYEMMQVQNISEGERRDFIDKLNNLLKITPIDFVLGAAYLSN